MKCEQKFMLKVVNSCHNAVFALNEYNLCEKFVTKTNLILKKKFNKV